MNTDNKTNDCNNLVNISILSLLSICRVQHFKVINFEFVNKNEEHFIGMGSLILLWLEISMKILTFSLFMITVQSLVGALHYILRHSDIVKTELF